MGAEAIRVVWTARRTPLEPVAVVGRGPVAVALARRLLSARDEDLSRWAVVASTGPSPCLLALGEAATLPWVDGVVYLGRDPGAASLLLPTALAPSVPPALLERALLARAAGLSAPVAVLLDPDALVGVGAARPLDRSLLARWIEASG